METKKVKITTKKQFETLVELLEKKPYLATGFNKSIHKFNIKDEWDKVAEKINYLGPSVRTGEGWKKVWEDYKFKLKKKLTHNKAECIATGGGSFKQFILSPTDEAAANLLQLHSIINPGGSIGTERRVSVLKDIEQNDADNSMNEEYLKENDKPSTSKSTKKPEAKQKTKYELLSEQLKVQNDLYTEVKHSLKEIERYNRKRFKLEEEKLVLYKNELTKKEEQRKSTYQLRKEELEIKKRKLELEEIQIGLKK